MNSQLTFVVLLAYLLCQVSSGFQVSTAPATLGTWKGAPPLSPMALRAGFGGAVATKKKKSDKKKKASSSTSFDASASLIRMEKIYDELSQQEARRIIRDEDADTVHGSEETATAEYVITARCAPTIDDWVPVAQIIVARPFREAETSEGSADPLVRAAVSHCCREISHVAGMGSRVFQSIPRNNFQYAVESVDSFHKHVYQVVLEGKHDDAENEHVMTKKEARQALRLEDDQTDMADIKRAYRTLSMGSHPDRFIGQSDDARDLGASEYAKYKLAYETLQSGVRNGKRSWYESLGGRSRTDFSVVPELLSLDEAAAVLKSRQTTAAVCGLDPEMVQTFVARCQSAVMR